MAQIKSLSYLAIPALLTFASLSFAQSSAVECSSDSDCAEGSLCEKAQYVNGCSSEEAECDTTVHEEETGTCVEQPVECETDADCGEYLGCFESSSGSCWQSSDGTSGCSEPDPDAPKYCAPTTVECETDSDCPREFECLSVQACPLIGCAEGADCDIECTETSKQCSPKEIECASDDACPSDWSCVMAPTGCSGSAGGGSVEPDPGAPTEPAPTEPAPTESDAPDEVACEDAPAMGFCQPDAWGESYSSTGGDLGAPTAGENGSLESDGADSSGGESKDDESDASGCSVSSAAPGKASGWAWLLILGAPLWLIRRRSAAQLR